MPMTRLRQIIPLLLVAILIVAHFTPISTAQESTPEAAITAPSLPDVTAKAVYVKDISLGEVLYSLDENERRSPASLTKLATAVVVLSLADNMDELVTIDQADVLLPTDGQSMVGVVAGDVFTVQDMIYGLLLNSGNDIADSLARHFGQELLAEEAATGDPVERFILEMNTMMTEAGLSETQFRNVDGLYDPDHYTSAHDMSAIAETALADELVQAVVATETYDITSQAPGGQTYTLENTNQLLGEDGVDGMKTGTLSESGACLVATKVGPGGTRILSVVLGSDIAFDENEFQIPESDMRYSDTLALFNAMEQDYQWIDPLQSASMPGLQAELDVWDVGFSDGGPVLLQTDEMTELRYLLRLGPPAEAGTEAGEVQFYSGDVLVAQKPVIELNAAA